MFFYVAETKNNKKRRRILNLSDEEFWELSTLLENLEDQDEVYYGNGLSVDNPALYRVLLKLYSLEKK